MSSQPFQTTQVATPPATTTFPGRDLISIRDLSPIEIEIHFPSRGTVQGASVEFPDCACRQADGDVLRKAIAAHPAHLRGRHGQHGRQRLLHGPDRGRLDAREKLSDIAHNVERWVDAIVLRTYSHGTVEGMAEHACIPVINALSDLEHPCQALADYFTLLERFGDLKKICLAYVGDGNNVAHSLLLTAATLGSRIRIATPEGYACDAQIVS